MKRHIVALLIVCTCGILGGIALSSIENYVADARHALLRSGSMVPSVEIVDARRQRFNLRSVMVAERANFIVILSATCRRCLGELASWRDAVADNRDLRPIVLIESENADYLQYIDGLIRPQYATYRIRGTDMEALGALATPVAYEVNPDGRVVSRAIGVEAVLELRYD